MPTEEGQKLFVGWRGIGSTVSPISEIQERETGTMWILLQSPDQLSSVVFLGNIPVAVGNTPHTEGNFPKPFICGFQTIFRTQVMAGRTLIIFEESKSQINFRLCLLFMAG